MHRTLAASARTTITFLGGYLFFLSTVVMLAAIEGPRVTYIEVWFTAIGTLLIYFIATVITLPIVKVKWKKIAALSAFAIGAVETACILMWLAWWSLPTTRLAGELFSWYFWATTVAAGVTAVFLAWGYGVLCERLAEKQPQ